MRRLGAQNLAEERPSAAVLWFFHTHPTIDERIAAAREFKSRVAGLVRTVHSRRPCGRFGEPDIESAHHAQSCCCRHPPGALGLFFAGGAASAAAEDHDAQRGVRLQLRRRLPARQLQADRGVLEDARQRVRPHGRSTTWGRPPRGGPSGWRSSPRPRTTGTSRATSEISRRLALAEGLDRRPGARAGEGRQGGRLDRRRPARDRDARARSSSARWSTRWSAAPTKRRGGS